MNDIALRPDRRRSRVWLYAPYGVLVVIAIAWSIGWVAIRSRTVAAMDEWLASEGRASRTWSCDDRGVGGYPFRIEVTCASLSVRSPDTEARLGRVVVVSQIYDPQHLIAEASGPLQLTSGATTLSASWSLLQASLHLSGGRPQRGDLVLDKPMIEATLAGGDRLPLSADHLEIHARPDPKDATAVDAALSAVAAHLPGIAAWTGSEEPLGIDASGIVTRVYGLARQPGIADVERWRLAGGQVEIAQLLLGQGARRLDIRGTLALDELHRPMGRLDLAGRGMEDILSRFVGGRAASLLGTFGAIFGSPAPARAEARSGEPPLQPLPTLRLTGGKLQVGPLVTGVKVPPLY